MITPYIPVPETNGEEWDRLEPMPAVDALIELVVHGEYSGSDPSKLKGKQSLQLRAAGSIVFEVSLDVIKFLSFLISLQNYTRKEEVRLIILKTMIENDGAFLLLLLFGL